MASLGGRGRWRRGGALASIAVVFTALSCAGPSSVDQSPDYIRKNESAVVLDDDRVHAARRIFDRWEVEGHRPTRVELEELFGIAHSEVKFEGELDLFWFGHSEIITAYFDEKSMCGYVQILRQWQQ